MAGGERALAVLAIRAAREKLCQPALDGLDELDEGSLELEWRRLADGALPTSAAAGPTAAALPLSAACVPSVSHCGCALAVAAAHQAWRPRSLRWAWRLAAQGETARKACLFLWHQCGCLRRHA